MFTNPNVITHGLNPRPWAQPVEETPTVIKQQQDAEIAELKRKYKTDCIVEIAVENPNVAEYVRHWEGRAEAAEADLAEETPTEKTPEEIEQEISNAKPSPEDLELIERLRSYFGQSAEVQLAFSNLVVAIEAEEKRNPKIDTVAQTAETVASPNPGPQSPVELGGQISQ